MVDDVLVHVQPIKTKFDVSFHAINALVLHGIGFVVVMEDWLLELGRCDEHELVVDCAVVKEDVLLDHKSFVLYLIPNLCRKQILFVLID